MLVHVADKDISGKKRHAALRVGPYLVERVGLIIPAVGSKSRKNPIVCDTLRKNISVPVARTCFSVTRAEKRLL